MCVAVRFTGSRIQWTLRTLPTAASNSACVGMRFSAAACFQTRVIVSAEGSSAPPVTARHLSNKLNTSNNSGETRTARSWVRNQLLNSLSGSQELRIRASRSISAKAACSAFSACASDSATTFSSRDVPSTFSYWKIYKWPRAVAVDASARQSDNSIIPAQAIRDFLFAAFDKLLSPLQFLPIKVYTDELMLCEASLI